MPDSGPRGTLLLFSARTAPDKPSMTDVDAKQCRQAQLAEIQLSLKNLTK